MRLWRQVQVMSRTIVPLLLTMQLFLGFFQTKAQQQLVIQFGKTTTEQLRKVWGEPKVVVGKHPKSGRLWEFRDGTNIRTDSSRSVQPGNYVIEGLGISGWPGRLSEAEPARNLYLKGLLGLRIGDSQSAVRKELTKQKLSYAISESKIVIADRSGTISLEFKRKGLVGLGLDYRND
jgi:hypothetical protein